MLKRLICDGTSISYGIVQPGEHAKRGVPFLQTTNISKPELTSERLQRTTPEIAAMYPRTRLAEGDVVLGIRASIGAAHVVPKSLAGANLSRGIARIVPDEKVTADYLVLFLRSRATASYWDFAKQGTTFNEVAISNVRNLPVVVPPLDEQSEILCEIKTLVSPLEAVLDRTRREIDLIREYRTRLVSDVVTGKLDVRGVAPQLPALESEDVEFDEPEEAEVAE